MIKMDTSKTIVLTGHSKSVIKLIQLNNGLIASASIDKNIMIWKDNGDGTYGCIQSLNENSNSVNCVSQLNNGDIAFGLYN